MQSGYLLRNRYSIEKPLSAGGFGETYIAIDEDYPDRREVVVKHLKPQSNDPAGLDIARRLFITEAKTLAQLGEKTDRIPTLYAYFEEQGEFYLVQEFIDGRTLTQELGTRKLAPAETIEIVREILTGLVEVHISNIIHRDLKPDNIIRRSRDNKLVLIDFGAVKAVRQTTLKTSNAKLSQSIGIGTDGYMPTEQAMGYPNTASDIYAIGAIALQCLTGIHPTELFDDDVMEFRWRHLCQVSDRTASLLSKMVASRHPDRYLNAMEAIKAIDLLLTPPTIPSPTSSKAAPAVTIRSSAPPIPPKPAVTIQSPAPLIRKDRRTFIKWATFGGSGFISVFVLSQLFKKPEAPVTGTAPATEAPETEQQTATATGSGFPALKAVIGATKTAGEAANFDAATTEFSKFEDAWKTLEGKVKAKKPADYKAIEVTVEAANLAIATKDKAALLASLQKLSGSLDKVSK